jgi:dihydroorotase
MKLDLVITGGRVINPASGRDEIADVAVSGTQIVEIASSIDVHDATRVIDASGLIITPGLVDLHVHAYHGVNAYGTDVDPICTSTGVTTAVDAGSSGPVNFAGFKQFIADSSTTRLLGFVAVAQHGVTRDPGDLVHPDFADSQGAAKVVNENPDICVGIKIRLAQDKVETDGRDALDLALEAGIACNRPIMVHIGETPLPLEEIVASLRPGDIITHCFTPLSPSITHEDGRLRNGILEAQRRGVIFDVAHAGGHFGWDIVRNSMSGGLMPNSLSTDIHGRTSAKERGFLLPDVMSKFLALGLSLNEVVRLTTLAPAQIIGWQDRLGSLEVGREADIAILSIDRQPVTFYDTEGVELAGNERLGAVWTIRSGQIFGPPDSM